jgi:hypothetical protein
MSKKVIVPFFFEISVSWHGLGLLNETTKLLIENENEADDT